MTEKLCKKAEVLGAGISVPSAVTLSVLWPTHVCFVLYFLRRMILRSKTKLTTPMTLAVMTYMVLSTLSLSLWCWISVFEPIRQLDHGLSIEGCRTTSFFAWSIGASCYLALIEAFFHRLNSVFQDSVYKIKPKIGWIFHCLFVLNYSMQVVFFVLYVNNVDCWKVYRHGFLAQAGIFPKESFWCSTNRETELILGISSGSIIFITCSVVLLYMFVTRLKILDDQNHNIKLHKLMIKSTVLTFSGLLSSVSAIILVSVTGFESIAFADLLLNLIFLYCLFRFGDSLYHWLFDRIVSAICRYFKYDHILKIIHHHSMHDRNHSSQIALEHAKSTDYHTRATATVQSDIPGNQSPSKTPIEPGPHLHH